MSLVTELVRRSLQARGKTRLQRLLKEARDRGHPKANFAVRGTPEELEAAVADAVDGHFVSRDELIRLVDDLEEIGGQHIFLYKLTKAGKAKVTIESLEKHFPPRARSVAYYIETPNDSLVEFVHRDGLVYLKQVLTAEYWEINRDESVWNDEVRRRVWEKQRRRAINLLIIDLKKGRAEVCIDRVRGENDEKLADKQLTAFLISLGPFIDAEADLVPVPISHALGRIVRETLDEAFMNADGAFDDAIDHAMSNRRKGTKGQDIRRNPSWNLDDEDYERNGLTIYWFTGAATPGGVADAEDDGDEEEVEDKTSRPSVHTVISVVDRKIKDKRIEHTKIYISAKVSAKDRAHVISRIRHFAG